VAATPTVGAGVAWGPLRVGVEGGVAEEVVGATATLQRWSVDAGLGWSPSWVVGPDLAAGVAGAILHLRAADSPDQLAPTLAAWGDVGARWWPRPDVVVRVGARVGADLRAASVTTADGARVDLGRVWLTPAASLVVIFP
jgi:hypothetical protein